MGKTPKPLRIVVTDPAMMEWDEIKVLQGQGHTIQYMIQLASDPDIGLVLGPNVWRMNNELRPFLDLAIEEARARAYPAKHDTL